MLETSISFTIFHLLWLVSFGVAYSLPPVVQLGGAIVAAVEQDAEQEAATEERQRVEREWLTKAETQLHSLINDDVSVEEVNNMLDSWSTEGRGKNKKQKKLMKMIYPLLAAAAVAKVVLLPLVLKWLTALSASSFVMGKIALATSGLLALRYILSGGHGHDRLEIIHSHGPAVKGLHGTDLSAGASNWMPIRQPFIPLGISKDHNFENLYKPFL
ncbi:uncharacterized protein LOC128262695 [Drosophila gunungcola]|uniref:Uncharacterized protein n=1 Tax=Drosophila gunungcola TaxID=103775 RepID=A0A9P9YX61_9MUSC|nr:uncharacterized protein LOC128262695 [Drosophila gunungcola]KAI8044339.1 hypothetical protein M5D96_000495 [Drosophila gunungcola]